MRLAFWRVGPMFSSFVTTSTSRSTTSADRRRRGHDSRLAPLVATAKVIMPSHEAGAPSPRLASDDTARHRAPRVDLARPSPPAGSEGSMALFIVRHQHEAERCPATDPYMRA